MAKRSETIKVRVTPDEKRKYERYLEDTGEFPSVSMFLRATAKDHIEDDSNEAEIDTEEITTVVESALEPVTERLERIEDEIAHVDTAVRSEEDIEDLAHDIAAALPIMDDKSGFEGQTEVLIQDRDDQLSQYEFAQAISTAAHWADYVDTDVSRTRRAIARAVEWFPDVQYFYDEELGERRYYRTSEGI